MAYKCFFTGIPAITPLSGIDSREYSRLMSDKLTTATDTVTSTASTGLSGTIIPTAIQFVYMNNAIFAIIPYTV